MHVGLRVECVNFRNWLGIRTIRARACSNQNTKMQGSRTRGAFILFEGIDRSGKTTQCSKLVEHLQKSRVRLSSSSSSSWLHTAITLHDLCMQQEKCELWRFPDRTTTLGQMINGYLQSNVELNDAAVHLMFAANRWEKRCETEGKENPRRLTSSSSQQIHALTSRVGHVARGRPVLVLRLGVHNGQEAARHLQR